MTLIEQHESISPRGLSYCVTPATYRPLRHRPDVPDTHVVVMVVRRSICQVNATLASPTQP
jgi:hypothetical protein